MQSWSASPYNLTQDNVKQEPDVELLSSDSFDPDPRPSRDPVRRSNRVRASASNLPIIINEEEYENDEDVNNEKLKGIVWPGMSLWDSATPEMQRKRNQKKAVSVVLNLERTSTQVEPFELIFDQAGEFRKKRNINDEPDSDDSLIKGEFSSTACLSYTIAANILSPQVSLLPSRQPRNEPFDVRAGRWVRGTPTRAAEPLVVNTILIIQHLAIATTLTTSMVKRKMTPSRTVPSQGSARA